MVFAGCEMHAWADTGESGLMPTIVKDLLQGSLKTRTLPDATNWTLTEPSLYDVLVTGSTTVVITSDTGKGQSVAQNQEFVVAGPATNTANPDMKHSNGLVIRLR